MTEEHKRAIAEGRKKKCIVCGSDIDHPIRGTNQWVHSNVCNYFATYHGFFSNGKMELSNKSLKRIDLIHKKYVQDRP